MTLQQELTSWRSPPSLVLSPVPQLGDQAPSTDRLTLPSSDHRPAIISFLRHCGCPFAEKSFRSLRQTASAHPDVLCIAVSHSDEASTRKWVEAVGGAGSVTVIVDAERELYAKWGLGVSTWAHILNPASLWKVYTLGRDENIWNRPTESGSRWQIAGSFAVDGDGLVKWSKVAQTTDDCPDPEEAVKLLHTS